MKKILFILILLMMGGFFVFTAQAQEKGTCTLFVSTSPGIPTTTYPNETSEQCKNRGGMWDPYPEGTVITVSDGYYGLLAPLPGLEEPINVKGEDALGKYLNVIIRLFIGLAAVLAMVMIVMGGIQYMTSELAHSKEAGKQRIYNAILGLLIAFGSYLILFTLNPDLLKTNVNIAGTEIEYHEPPIVRDVGTPPGVVSGCPEGVVKTIIDMFACRNIVQNINNMLTASRTAGLNITGGGYRSEAQQKQLRIEHCNGDYTNPNARCRPPTALPGQSNHNYGKAFDLRCDGVAIQTRDNKCFLWLQSNASRYGLRNLASEPWHWSVDGR